ncbi:MAG: hypothetical protein RIR26_2323 [Pseudomonadota bacterium]
MRQSEIGMLLGLIGSVSLSACAPNTQFKSSNLLDASREVKARSAGMNTGSADGSGQNDTGRLNIDCFLESLDAGKLLGEKPLKSIGIPSNCPSTSSTSSETSSVAKSDVAVALDTSENMLNLDKVAKFELALALNKLNAEGRIATLTAFAFRNKITATENSSDISKTIGLVTGSSPDWSPNNLKTIDPNSTEWITADAAKDVFTALKSAAAALSTGTQKSKILILITNSTGIGANGFDVGPTAKIISDLDASTARSGGVLTFNYAGSDKLAPSLSEYAPTPLAQLDMLASAAALKPVRAQLTEKLGGWGESIVTRSKIPSSANEACLLKQLDGTDASGKPVFKNEFSVSDKNGFQDISMPLILQSASFTITVTRQCEKSGETKQTVAVAATAKGGTSK